MTCDATLEQRIKEVKSDGSLGDETEKGVWCIDLPLIITMILDLLALKVRSPNTEL